MLAGGIANILLTVQRLGAALREEVLDFRMYKRETERIDETARLLSARLDLGQLRL